MNFKIFDKFTDQSLIGKLVTIEQTVEQEVVDVITCFVRDEQGDTLTGKIIEAEPKIGQFYIRNQHARGLITFEKSNVRDWSEPEPPQQKKRMADDAKSRFYNSRV